MGGSRQKFCMRYIPTSLFSVNLCLPRARARIPYPHAGRIFGILEIATASNVPSFLYYEDMDTIW